MAEVLISTLPEMSNGGSIPSGSVCMWSGSQSKIPAGWKLCNGQNGTPNLTNRFILGAGSKYTCGATGGSSTVSLSQSQMPSHSHKFRVNGADVKIRYRPSTGYVKEGRDVDALDDLDSSTSSITVSGNTDSAGSGSSHENNPPFYALCFIMKE